MFKIILLFVLCGRGVVGIVEPALMSVECIVEKIIISLNLDPVRDANIKIYAWNFTDDRQEIQVELDVKNPSQIRDLFKGHLGLFTLYIHDVGGSPLDEWIRTSVTDFFNGDFSVKVVISVGYGDFATNKKNALKYMDTISNKIADLIKIIDSEVLLYGYWLYGHGMGALIAAKTAEIMATLNKSPIGLYALDPEIVDTSQKDFLEICPIPQIPTIKRSAEYVYVVHTTTCESSLLIPACDNNSRESMGDVDIFVNGGMFQKGCKTDDPSCGRERAVLYFKEINAHEIYPATSPYKSYYSWVCTDYDSFVKGKCPNCWSFSQIKPCTNVTFSREMIFGKHYFMTNPSSPYGMALNGNKTS